MLCMCDHHAIQWRNGWRTKWRKRWSSKSSTKLIPDMNLFVDEEVHQAHWRTFKVEFKFTNLFMVTFIWEAWEDYLKSNMVEGGKNRSLPKYTAHVFSNFIKELKMGLALYPGYPQALEDLGLALRKSPEGHKDQNKDLVLLCHYGLHTILGSLFKGTMSTPFYDPFLAKFIWYAIVQMFGLNIYSYIADANLWFYKT